MMQTTIAAEQRVCPIHGTYTAKKFPVPGREIWSGCPECAREKIAKKNEALIHDISTVRGHNPAASGIPPRFIGKSLGGYMTHTPQQKCALHACKNFVDEFNPRSGRCMILVGPPGTGKTHLCSGMLALIAAAGHTTLYTRAITATQAVKQSFYDNTTSQTYDTFCTPDVLAIDEVGRQFGTDAEKNILFEVINRRYEQCKSTIVVSNGNIETLTEYLSEAGVSRLQEDGVMITITGPDMRIRR